MLFGMGSISTTTAFTIILTILLIIVLNRVWSWLSKVMKIPGNEILPIFGSWDDPFFRKFDLLKISSEFAEKHDGLFKIWMGPTPALVVSAPQYLKTYYTSLHALGRPFFYDIASEITNGCNVVTSTGETWKNSRKSMKVNFFNSISFETLRNNFVHEAEKMVIALRSQADGQVFPCSSILMSTTGKAILRNLADEEVSDEDLHQFLNSIYSILSVWSDRATSALKRYKLFYHLLPQSRVFQRDLDVFDTFLKKIIEKKRNHFLEMKGKGEKAPNTYVLNILENHGFSNEVLNVLLPDIKSLIFAGLDTTAGTMGFVLTVLGLFPEVQEKVYQEDQELQRRLQGRQLQAEDLQHYRYLERVIKETLRLFPAAPILGRKLTADTYFGKHLAPKGMDVIALQMYANRNPEIYPEPLKFDPDRYLPENAVKIPAYAFNPFSAGPRICLGMRYANMTMKIMLPAVVRQFKIYSKYKSLDEALDETDFQITLKDKQEWPIRLETRS